MDFAFFHIKNPRQHARHLHVTSQVHRDTRRAKMNLTCSRQRFVECHFVIALTNVAVGAVALGAVPRDLRPPVLLLLLILLLSNSQSRFTLLLQLMHGNNIPLLTQRCIIPRHCQRARQI